MRIAVIKWKDMHSREVSHVIVGHEILDNDGTLARKADRWAALSLSERAYEECTIELYSLVLNSDTMRKVK